MIKSEIYNQAGRKVQRMRNILVVLAMFVCTSICLGDPPITIDGDIVNHDKVRDLELELKPEREQEQREQEQEQPLKQLESQMPPPLFVPPVDSVLQRIERLENLKSELLYNWMENWQPKTYELEPPDPPLEQQQRQWQNHEIQQLDAQSRIILQLYLLKEQLPQIQKQLPRMHQQLWQQLRQLRQLPREQFESLQKQRLDLEQQQGQQLKQEIQQLESQLQLEPPPPLDSVQERLQRIMQFLHNLEEQPQEQEQQWQWLQKLEQQRQWLQKLEQQRQWLQKLEQDTEQEELERLLMERQQQKQRQQKLKLLEPQLELERKYSDIAGNGNPNKDPDKYKYGKALDGDIWNNPNNKRLTIDTGAKVGNAYGAKMNKASIVKSKSNKDFLLMTNNKIIVSGGEFGCDDTDGNIAGAWADDDIDVDMNISSNTVIITGGSKIKDVYGGRTKYGTVSLSTVTISNSVTIGQNVYGGYIVRNGTATLNKVNLTSVTVGGDVYGAMIECSDYGYEDEIYTLASSNEVTITSGKVRNVYGGYIVKDGTATLNKVDLTSVTVTNDVYGAKIGRGLASSNTVTITSGTVGRNVFGGYIVNNGTAIENKVDLTSVTVTNDVYGARIKDGLASSNTVTIASGKVKNVYGGYIVRNGTATENKVNLTSVTVSSDVFGAWIGDGLASINTVTITSGKVRNVFGGYIVNKGTAILNKVNLTSVTVRMDVYGAKIGNDERVGVGGEATKIVDDGLASSNTVTITSGTVGWNVYGGYIVKNGTATLNKVNLSDVDVTRDVYGANIGMGLASSNEVTITGGRVGGDVLGGYVYKDGTATGNKVTLTNVDVKRDVYGARIGTDRIAEFERAMEELTEVYAKALAFQIKYGIDTIGMDEAEQDEFTKRFGDELEETEEAIKASKGALAHAVEAAFERAGTAEKSKFKKDEEATIEDAAEDSNKISAPVKEFIKNNKTEAEIEEKIKETINKFKAKRTELKKDVVAELKKDVIAEIERAEAKRARTYVLASSNTVTITSGTVGRNVYGGYIHQNGTATLNKVNLTNVTATKDVYGAWIGNDGLASSNEVTIINGETVQNVYGGYIVKDGTATGNIVTISGGKVKGNVFGGYVCGNGEATYNTINITASTEFSPESILCGGICDPETKSNAVTGNTLNIETNGIEVKGISNFEKYKFHLKDIKTGETILTATSGGCSWNTREHNYTSDCAVDISRSNMNISLHTQGVLNKGDQYTLIKSPHGFEGEVETKQCDFENEGLLIKYYWNIKIADNKQELIAKLIDKKIRDEGVSRSLSEGYGAGVVCVNNGMDCIFSKMEETESLLGEGAKLGAKLPGKGEIGAFGGVAASKSKYDIDKGSHIDMIGTSMMGGVGVRMEVGSRGLSSTEQSSEQSSPELNSKKLSSKELGSELTVGVFAEHGTGESDINCEKKNEGKSSYTGGGLLGRYNIYEDEFSGTKGQSPKLYVEAILRAGQVENNFDSKKMKDSKGKEYKYKYADAMYGGCAVGGGYKHKVSEKINLDWSLRYMFGRQWEKDVKREDADGNRMKFKNVTSNRIRIGVRGKYVELEKIKPYAGIGCEYELDGKVKGAIENGVDMIDMPVSDFGGVTGIGELGVSGKIWKFGVDISGQGYLGVRKGFGGMLKLKYAFGKDAHGSKASRSKTPGSKPPRS